MTIYSREGEVEGEAHYRITLQQGGLEINGKARYKNGEWDEEEGRLETDPTAELPRLVHYSHRFYRSDGSLFLRAEADLKSGDSACVDFRTDSPSRLVKTITFPADTFAGASDLVPLEHQLKLGTAQEVRFHVFSCVPGPKVIAVKASWSNERVSWVHYPGDLIKVLIRPSFGIFDLVLRPFLPTLVAWFNPDADWLYVGAEVQRFYRGPTIELARALSDHQRSANRSGSRRGLD